MEERQRNIIIGVVIAVLVLCCCCGILAIFWFFGDQILESLGLGRILPAVMLL